jgi:DNA helicase-2/ATP-dependent DNA helicase PcrA
VWDGIYTAATAVLDRPQLIEALVRSYDGLFVDEYQDCTSEQHALVLRLAAYLPTRLLGDPLQGIFDFGGQQLVDFDDAVLPEFARLPDLDVPWRWRDTNAPLGEDLLQIRGDLLTYGITDLARYRTIRRIAPHPAAPVTTCREIVELGGSAVAIRAQPGQAHALARVLGGDFVSMEEAEGRAVIDAARAIESAAGPARATALLGVIGDCTTKVVPALATARQRFGAGEIPGVPKGKNALAVAALVALAETDSLQPVAPTIRELCAYPGAVVYRPEVPRDLIEAARIHALDPHPSLVEAAVAVRERGRRFGRQLAWRTVSRTLLVKGLEFDHAIVFDSAEQHYKHLYVALTRGTRSVTVML